MKNQIKNLLMKRLLSKGDLQQLNNQLDLRDLIKFQVDENILRDSTSQLGQDLFALLVSNYKKDGFFVEFGATDGMHLSNTYLLEKHFGWSGVLAEPSPSWHTGLRKNRKCIIDTRCVWSTSDQELTFHDNQNAELSTIEEYLKTDGRNRVSTTKSSFTVQTISLNDLLVEHNVPRDFDFLSVDTEGSEFEILNNFNFDMYRPKVIVVEHNYTEARDKIYSLLKSNGYLRELESLSRWDDWYIAN